MEREYRYSLWGLHICIKQDAGTGDNTDNNGDQLVSGTNSHFFPPASQQSPCLRDSPLPTHLIFRRRLNTLTSHNSLTLPLST